jgi:hypothetical protein
MKLSPPLRRQVHRNGLSIWEALNDAAKTNAAVKILMEAGMMMKLPFRTYVLMPGFRYQ